MHYLSEVASMLALERNTIRGRRRIPLAEIDGIVTARLGPGRVPGNAQPAAFNRQVAMYVANQVGGWSTTQIGKFYNGRDHSTVCYAIARIRALRVEEQRIDTILNDLTNEIGMRVHSREIGTRPAAAAPSKAAQPLLDDATLDAVAERIASRLISILASAQIMATGAVYEPDLSMAKAPAAMAAGADRDPSEVR
jgi:hypothetical protein